MKLSFTTHTLPHKKRAPGGDRPSGSRANAVTIFFNQLKKKNGSVTEKRGLISLGKITEGGWGKGGPCYRSIFPNEDVFGGRHLCASCRSSQKKSNKLSLKRMEGSILFKARESGRLGGVSGGEHGLKRTGRERSGKGRKAD